MLAGDFCREVVTEGMREDVHFSGVWFYVGKGVVDVCELVSWEVLWIVVPSVYCLSRDV